MLMVNVTPELLRVLAFHIIICGHEFSQPEGEVLQSLVEAGMIVHEP